MVSFVYLSAECPFDEFYGINGRPKLDAKLIDRFFHRRRQVSPPVNSLTHRFFDGSQHLLYCNVTVGSRHGVAAGSLRAVAYKPASVLDEESIQPSLYWHDRRSALVLDHEHQEFRRRGTACVPVNDMNIVGSFIEGLSWCQCYLLSTLQLHHNGALQYVNKRLGIVSVDSARPAGRMLDRDH